MVCERVPAHLQKCSLPELQRKKFLVPAGMTLAQFSLVVKKQIQEERPAASAETLYFLLRNRRAPVMSKTIRELHDEFSSEDGFLYLHFCAETVFGRYGVVVDGKGC